MDLLTARVLCFFYLLLHNVSPLTESFEHLHPWKYLTAVWVWC